MKPIGPTQSRILDALQSGEWVRGRDLHARACPGTRFEALFAVIERLRDRGYEIEADQSGTLSKGYRLVQRQSRAA